MILLIARLAFCSEIQGMPGLMPSCSVKTHNFHNFSREIHEAHLPVFLIYEIQHHRTTMEDFVELQCPRSNFPESDNIEELTHSCKKLSDINFIYRGRPAWYKDISLIVFFYIRKKIFSNLVNSKVHMRSAVIKCYFWHWSMFPPQIQRV